MATSVRFGGRGGSASHEAITAAKARSSRSGSASTRARNSSLTATLDIGVTMADHTETGLAILSSGRDHLRVTGGRHGGLLLGGDGDLAGLGPLRHRDREPEHAAVIGGGDPAQCRAPPQA